MAPLVASKAVLQEVAGLIRLVRIGESTADEIRLLIGESRNAFRKAVRQAFDAVLANGASVPALEPRARARQLSPQLKRRIEAAAAAGDRPIQISRKFRIGITLAAKICGTMGSPYKKGPFTAKQISGATKMLEAGQTWPQVAKRFGCSKNALQRFVKYRKPLPKRPTDEQLAQATQLLKDGHTWEHAARYIGTCRRTLQKYTPYRKVKVGAC